MGGSGCGIYPSDTHLCSNGTVRKLRQDKALRDHVNTFLWVLCASYGVAEFIYTIFSSITSSLSYSFYRILSYRILFGPSMSCSPYNDVSTDDVRQSLLTDKIELDIGVFWWIPLAGPFDRP
eukprot:GHVS01002788.1.p1 GENE.GHVS01002788.1~~GHVS01002788.1.p1  ORF type:complete len:122 (-),score=9.28 GHVS01002788.1:308-673(-)